MFELEVGDLLWSWVLRVPEAQSVWSRVRGDSCPGKILKKGAISCSLRPIAALFHANLNLNFYIFFTDR